MKVPKEKLPKAPKEHPQGTLLGAPEGWGGAGAGGGKPERGYIHTDS